MEQAVSPKSEHIDSEKEENALLWSPSQDRKEKSLMCRFVKSIEKKYDQSFDLDYHRIWQWSVENQEEFWDEFWDFANVIGDKGDRVFLQADKMQHSRFFPDAKINFAENLLRRSDKLTALVFRDEKGAERTVSYKELNQQVSQWVQAFKDLGVVKGDRVAGYMPNMPETIIAMLAASALGAIWSSASPDFGVQGVLDRFGQIEPKVLVTVDAYYYNGKPVDTLAKLRDIQPQLPSLEKTVIVPFAGSKSGFVGLSDTSVTMDDFLSDYSPSKIAFERVEFDHPLFIMFSSGTTGAPKCIVHGHGGTLLQHLKELKLHTDIYPEDVVFYFTTCGWMMWNWIVSALACEATLLLYDGSPFYPSGDVLWDYTSSHGCKLFGTSAKYIDAMKGHDIHPGEKYDLSDLEVVASTGSPLVHESFDFVYEHIKKDLHLASITGGTDIISASFGIGNPLAPVYRGELQGPSLATAVDVFDHEGNSIPYGKGTGELVCTKPFPSMPVMFWNDENGEKYHEAYFDTYPNVWHHGDWVEKTSHYGLIVHGRSDATLNPGGVRIGTAEIYRQVEQIEEVAESIAVGQDFNDDQRVILFVVLKDGVTLDRDLQTDIKIKIRRGASPRHVPAKIIQVPDIPRTRSGKITEIAVRNVIHGREVKNKEALANPEVLEHYANIQELQK